MTSVLMWIFLVWGYLICFKYNGFRLCLTMRNKSGARITSMLGYSTSDSGRWGSGLMLSLTTVSPPDMEN